MPKTYYCSIRGNVTGPFPGSVITQMAATGAIGPEDLIRPAEQEEWYKAEYIQGLFDADAQSLRQANCPGCQAPMTYDARFFGQRFKCAKCLQVVEINEQGIPRLVAPNAASAQAVEPALEDPHPIKYKCQHCKAALETSSSMGMREEPCPVCKTVNRVPQSKQQQQEQKDREKAKQRHIREQLQRDEAERRAEEQRRREQAKAESQPLAAASPAPVPAAAAPPTAPLASAPPPPPMSSSLSAGAFVGNVLWFIFGGGMFLALGWLFLGAIMCCTVIGIPFGMAAFRIAGFAAFPFGRELVDARLLGEERICGTAVANLLWVVLAGLWLAIGHALAGVVNLFGFIFVLPVFWAMANFKLASACFAPLGKRAVPKAYARALLQAHAQRRAEAAGSR
jgi:uncharacterized membrane protein YccF (DUF307 family)/phage FluMu protein Com/uncharacterized protein YbaR (Trm112 family)